MKKRLDYDKYLKTPKLDITFEIGESIKVYNQFRVFIQAEKLPDIPKEEFFENEKGFNILFDEIFKGVEKKPYRGISEDTWEAYEGMVVVYNKIYNYLSIVCETLSENGVHECFLLEDELLQQAWNLEATLNKLKEEGSLINTIQSKWNVMKRGYFKHEQ